MLLNNIYISIIQPMPSNLVKSVHNDWMTACHANTRAREHAHTPLVPLQNAFQKASQKLIV
jgi:hypothetical protein